MLSDLRESGCLTADTRILRADTGAEVTLGRAASSRGATDVPVWSLDESLRYVRRHHDARLPTGAKEVFRLTARLGQEVKATANHPFLTFDGWRRWASSRRRPHRRPRHVPAPSTPCTAVAEAEQVVLLAHLLGDGCVRAAAADPLRSRSTRRTCARSATAAAALRHHRRPRRVRGRAVHHAPAAARRTG